MKLSQLLLIPLVTVTFSAPFVGSSSVAFADESVKDQAVDAKEDAKADASKAKRHMKKGVRKLKGTNTKMDNAKDAVGDKMDEAGAEVNKVKEKND